MVNKYPKVVTVRISEESHAELQRIAGDGPHGRCQFVRDALADALRSCVPRKVSRTELAED